jgi:hypothetical protein
MKKLVLGILLFLSTVSVNGQIIHVNWGGVYPVSSSTVNYNLDIDNNGTNDLRITTGLSSGNYFSYLMSLNNTTFNSSNLINIPVNDCTNDTLNIMSSWTSSTKYFYFQNGLPIVPYSAVASTISIGPGGHKAGFRLSVANPATGANGFKYGYINYALNSNGDIFIYDWYYENTFNTGIVANGALGYPFDSNCLHYDTVTVQDTLVTQVYDTITTHISVYDTVLVSVTDTLIINTTLNLPAPNNTNIIKVYPNPASDHITIDNGNFALMNGYSIKIENSTGQQVFNASVNQAQFYIDISTWTGNGLYFIHLIDPTNNTVTIRKLVVQ